MMVTMKSQYDTFVSKWRWNYDDDGDIRQGADDDNILNSHEAAIAMVDQTKQI